MPDVNDALATLISERYEVVRAGSGEAAVETQNAPSGNAAAPPRTGDSSTQSSA